MSTSRRGVADRGRVQREDRLDIVREEARIAVVEAVLGKQKGDRLSRLRGAHGARKEEPADAFHLARRRPVRREAREIAEDLRLEPLERHSGPCEREDAEERGAAALVERHRERQRERVVFHEAAPEPSRFTRSEDAFHYREGEEVGMTPFGHLEVDMQRRHRRVAVVHSLPPLARRGGLRKREARRGLARGHFLEGILHAAEGVSGLDVTHDRQKRVGRSVVAAVEVPCVVERSRLKVVHRSDDGVLVGKGVVGERVGGLERRGVRLVVHAQALLLLHGLALVVELFLREDEGAHPVGFQEEGEVEGLGG